MSLYYSTINRCSLRIPDVVTVPGSLPNVNVPQDCSICWFVMNSNSHGVSPSISSPDERSDAFIHLDFKLETALCRKSGLWCMNFNGSRFIKLLLIGHLRPAGIGLHDEPGGRFWMISKKDHTGEYLVVRYALCPAVPLSPFPWNEPKRVAYEEVQGPNLTGVMAP